MELQLVLKTHWQMAPGAESPASFEGASSVLPSVGGTTESLVASTAARVLPSLPFEQAESHTMSGITKDGIRFFIFRGPIQPADTASLFSYTPPSFTAPPSAGNTICASASVWTVSSQLPAPCRR